jgi:hypothetical protein
MALRQRFIYRRHDLLIRQHPVGVRHPVFAKIAHFLKDQTVSEAELCPAHLNHAVPPCAFDVAPDAAAHD